MINREFFKEVHLDSEKAEKRNHMGITFLALASGYLALNLIWWLAIEILK